MCFYGFLNYFLIIIIFLDVTNVMFKVLRIYLLHPNRKLSKDWGPQSVMNLVDKCNFGLN